MFVFKSPFLRLSLSNFPRNHSREYARWASRRPKRVLPSEEAEEEPEREHESEEAETFGKINWKHPEVTSTLRKLDDASDTVVQYKIIPKKQRAAKQKLKLDTTDMLQTIIDSEGNFVYTKLRDHDPTVGTLLVQLKSVRLRDTNDLILLEGKRLIRDALESKCKLHSIIFSRKSLVDYLKPYLPRTGANIYKIPYKEIQMWSDLTTSPGIMGIFNKPDTEQHVPETSIPLTVICDNIREPGNLGGVLRTLSGAGVQEVILTKGCTDLWDCKVLRGSCGSHFRLRICTDVSWNSIRERLGESGARVFVADSDIFTDGQEKDESDDDDDEVEPVGSVLSRVPLVPYYGVDFAASKSLVLVIGGETEGISREAYRLAADFNGARLNVPLCNGVESLNVGAALGVLAFEIKRQLIVNRDRET